MAILRFEGDDHDSWGKPPREFGSRFKVRYKSLDTNGKMANIKPLEWGAQYSEFLLGYQRSTFGPTFDRKVLLNRQRGIKELLDNQGLYDFFQSAKEFEFYLHPKRTFRTFPSAPPDAPKHSDLSRLFEELQSLNLEGLSQRPNQELRHTIEVTLERIQKHSDPYLGAAVYIKEAQKRGIAFSPVSFTDSGVIEFKKASIPFYRAIKADVHEFESGMAGTSLHGPHCDDRDEDTKEPFVPIDIRYDFNKKGHINKGPQSSGKSTSIIESTICIVHGYTITYAPAAESEMGINVLGWEYIRSAPKQKEGESGLGVICTDIAKRIARHQKPMILFLEDVVGGGTSEYGVGQFLEIFDSLEEFKDVFLVMNSHQPAAAFENAVRSGRYTATTFDIDHSQHPLGFVYKDNAGEVIKTAFEKALKENTK